MSDNKDITKHNKNSIVKYPVDILFDEELRHKITVLYTYGIFPTEISDVLNLDIREVVEFCRIIPRTNYSNLSNYEKVKRRRKKLKVLGIIYKGSKCYKCGYDKYFEVLDFHHIDPSKKDFTISNQCNRSWNKLKKELDKCVVLCPICHRELHVEQNKKDITPTDLKLIK
jgi:hypothetical protein